MDRLPQYMDRKCTLRTLTGLAVDMSRSNAYFCDSDTRQEVVFVQSGADGLISVPSSYKSAAVLQNDAAAIGTAAIINQTSFDIPHSSIAETVDCNVDLTAVSANPVVKETDSLPLPVSWSQLEKRNVIMCKLIRSGNTVLLQVPKSFLSVSGPNKLDERKSNAAAGLSAQTVTVSPVTETQSRVNKLASAVKVGSTKRCRCINNEHCNCRRFKCSFGDCKWAFPTNYKLQRHMEVHLRHKTYVCHIPGCSRTFSSPNNLRTHIKLHDRNCNEACQMPGCEAKFSTRRLLDNHMKEQHPSDKQYSCSYPGCGKSFAFKWNLMSHARKHNVGSESLQCQFDGCGRRFDHVCRLRQHERMHTGERPHACPAPGCSWAFTTASKLQRHLLRHTGQRQWVCPCEGCGKTFARLEHVRGHMSTHSDHRPYSCNVPGCDAKFKYKSSLFVHKRRHESKFNFKVEDCSDMTDVAAYASIIAPSISQSMDDIMTSHGITFRDLETGAFYLQTQLLQDDPLTPEMCDFEDSGDKAAADADTPPACFTDLGIDDNDYTATTINLHDLE